MRSPNAARSKLLRPTSRHSLKAQLSLSRKSSKSSDVGAASEEGDENEQPGGLHRDNNNNIGNNNDDPKASGSPSGKAAKEDAKAVEARMKKQLTKLRARMQAMVTDAQLETQYVKNTLFIFFYIFFIFFLYFFDGLTMSVSCNLCVILIC